MVTLSKVGYNFVLSQRQIVVLLTKSVDCAIVSKNRGINRQQMEQAEGVILFPSI